MHKPAYQTERKPIIDFFDVGFPTSWPKAESSKCSLFEAINIVGSAIYGTDWTGQELTALNWIVQPVFAEQNRIEALAKNFSAKRVFPNRSKGLLAAIVRMAQGL